MEQPFLGKIVLVTGSGRGIGRAIALHFASLGADLIINFFRNRSPAEKTASLIREMGREALLVKANVGEIDDLLTMFNKIDEAFGGLDILIHNAASGYNRPVLMQRLKGWQWTMDINARSLLFEAKYATPLMEKRGGGSIVAISSPGANHVLPDYAVIGASKAAIETIVRYLAVELAPKNIIANAISPGVVLTEALQHFDATRQEETITCTIRLTPAGRLVTPEDIAGVAAFLCSPQAIMLRGQVISLDGGITLLAPGVNPPIE